jgi:hypothetical protein
MTAPDRPRAAIYVRVSTTTQEHEGTSLASQEEHCRHYAIERGYQVGEGHTYREVHTGAELWERPALTLLRESIRKREIGALIVYALDRCRASRRTSPSSRRSASAPLCASSSSRGVRARPGRSSSSAAPRRSPPSWSARRSRADPARPARAAQGGQAAPRLAAPVRLSLAGRGEVGPAHRRGTAPVVRRIFAEVLAGRSLRSVAPAAPPTASPTPTGQEGWKQSPSTTSCSIPAMRGRPRPCATRPRRCPARARG